MNWGLVYSNRARRDIRSLDPSVARRVFQSLERLAQTGYGDVTRLHGQEKEWRLRVGQWRVRLTFESESHVIRVFRVLRCSQAYRE